MAARKSARTNVFISYSHKDKKWRELFQASLKPLIRANQFSVWDDTQIKAGDVWRDEIKKALSSARVAVLLVSMNFCNSDFIAENELPPLLEAAQNEGLKIHLVIVGHSLFDETELGRYQAVNDPSKPLAAMTAASREREIVRICREIKAAVTSPPAVKPGINIEGATSGRPTDQPESITVYPASAHLRNLGS
jgi:TIR domain